MTFKNNEIQRKYKREWYRKNKSKIIDEVASRRNKIREWLVSYKEKLKCEKCGEDHPSCIDFHHLDKNKKEMAVSSCVHRGWSISRIKNEINKCSVVCSNCHRKLHWDD